MSTYDKARKAMKAAGMVTKQSMTKKQVVASLVRSKNAELKALGKQLVKEGK